jgi:hypothetical protein
MIWLFGQLWFLLLLAFLVGVVLAWAIARVALKHVDDVQAFAAKGVK